MDVEDAHLLLHGTICMGKLVDTQNSLQLAKGLEERNRNILPVDIDR